MTTNTPKIKPIHNLIISAISASVAEIITLPICTAKTRYQNTESTSIRLTIREIYQQSGIRGFYHASIPAIAGQAFSTSSKYMLYRYFESKNFHFSNKMINGMMGGVISSLMTHPLDFVRVRMQMEKPIISEIKNVGLRVIYRGYSKTFSKVILSSSLFFPIYDTALEFTKNAIKASFVSAVISTLVIHPVDFLKTRHIDGLPLFLGWDPRRYYKGLTLNLARIVPHFIIMMTLIDKLTTLKNN